MKCRRTLSTWCGATRSMVAIPVPAMDPVALQTALFEQHRIEVPVTSHGGRIFVRLSLQGYNSAADTDALVAALASIFRR